MLDQGYRTAQGAIIDVYEEMVNDDLQGKSEESCRRTCSKATSYNTNLTSCHMGLNPRLRCESRYLTVQCAKRRRETEAESLRK
jgi:hypothetical protein